MQLVAGRSGEAKCEDHFRVGNPEIRDLRDPSESIISWLGHQYGLETSRTTRCVQHVVIR